MLRTVARCKVSADPARNACAAVTCSGCNTRAVARCMRRLAPARRRRRSHMGLGGRRPPTRRHRCDNCAPHAIDAQAQTTMAAMMDLERTYIMIKPDGVQRGLIGDIVKRFEQKGFKLVAAKLYSPSRAHFEKHYEDLKGKKFFPSMIDYMITGPVFCMVWAGKGAVKTGRKMLGETNPADSLPGSIRGDFCIDIGRNICHGSDTVENAEKEIALWFPEGTNAWTSHSQGWIYE